MRARLLLLAPLFLACSPDEVLPIEAADLDQHTFSGEFTDSLSCSPGVVDFEVAQGADGLWTGTYRFESTGEQTAGDAALYEIEGEIGDDGLLHMAQVGILEADAREGWSWCTGEMSLALVGDAADPLLMGDWYARDCGCAGNLSFLGDLAAEPQAPHLTW